MLACLGDKAALVDMVPDTAIEAIVGTWPSQFDTSLAKGLGFRGDTGFADIYAQACGDSV